MEKEYNVEIEIAGSAAMFTRPDTGSSPVSYPAPTFSAAKGIFESIARLKSAYIRPMRVEICAPIQYQRYTTNYGGPLRKSNQISGGNSYQLIATILVDVCYRIYGMVEEIYKPTDVKTNHLHHLKEMFEWRRDRGKCYHVPCLGWKEFTPSYFGPFRDSTKIEETIEKEEIPSMLFSVFNTEGQYRPVYKQNVLITKGVLIYA